MARQRRGGGFRPPELRGTLGTLVRTTIAQAGTLRDVLERGAREGRTRLDAALSNRRRHDALADLGEIVLHLIREGEIDLDELPEARDIVAHLDDLDASHDDDHDERIAAPPARNRDRFDTRSQRSLDRDDDDGTVSAKTWRTPGRSKPPPRVWRPPTDHINEEEAGDDRGPVPSHPPPGAAARITKVTTRERPSSRRTDDTPPSAHKSPLRKGGISFDDDDDLADYMHPDDVPPKDPADGDP